MNLYHNEKNNTLKIEVPLTLTNEFLEAINAHINEMVERVLEEYPNFEIKSDIQSALQNCDQKDICELLKRILPFEILAKKLEHALSVIPVS